MQRPATGDQSAGQNLRKSPEKRISIFHEQYFMQTAWGKMMAQKKLRDMRQLIDFISACALVRFDGIASRTR
jgi:hypothetical protein